MSGPHRHTWLGRWASRTGRDDSRDRPLLRIAYQGLVVTETALAGLCASRRSTDPVDPGTVTLAVKTFERPEVLRRMLRSVRRVFAGPILVADDSQVGFQTDDPLVRVLRLPFDSGIGAGRNALLDAVQTEYVFMADDDMTLLPDFDLRRPLGYLERNSQVDLCGGRVIHLPLWRIADYSAAALFAHPGAPRLRQGSIIDGLAVSYKVPNFYLARTDRVRAVRYDDRLKRMDHNDFFSTAYGTLVCVVDPAMVCLHAHSFFDSHYQSFRMDFAADQAYLGKKWGGAVRGETGAGLTDQQRVALHHAAVQTLARGLGIAVVHHGTPTDRTVSVSVCDNGLRRLLPTLRTLGWSGTTARQLTHPLWGDLRVRAGGELDGAVAASFAMVHGYADSRAWPAPVDRVPGQATTSPAKECDSVGWDPKTGWVDDGDTVVGALLPLGPVHRLDFPGDLIWEVIGPHGATVKQVVTEVLAAFAETPPEAADHVRDYLERLIAQGLLVRSTGSNRLV